MSLQDKTVVQLKALARERGLKRYSKLKKADLIQLLNVPASLLDEDVPQIGLPDPVQPVQAPFPKTKTPLSKPLEKSRILDQPLWKLKQEIYTNHFRNIQTNHFCKKKYSSLESRSTSPHFVRFRLTRLLAPHIFFTILFHFTPPSFLSSLRSLRHSSSVK